LKPRDMEFIVERIAVIKFGVNDKLSIAMVEAVDGVQWVLTMESWILRAII